MPSTDGSVRLDVDLNIDKADKELSKLKQKIVKLETTLAKETANRDTLSAQFAKASAEVDNIRDKIVFLKDEIKNATSTDQKDILKDELSEALEEQKLWTREAQKLENAYDKANTKVKTTSDQISDLQDEYGNLERTIAANRPMENVRKTVESAQVGLKNILKYSFGVSTLLGAIGKIKSGLVSAFKEFAKVDTETKKNVNNLKASLASLRGSWAAAFAPIVNAVLPYLQKLIDWLTSAGNAVARFIAILAGKSTYKKAVANMSAITGATDSTTAAAEEAAEAIEEEKKQLMAFDELNILESDDDSSGSGGSGGSSGSSSKSGSEYTLVDEPTNADDDSFLSNLALKMKDVLFDWSDLNEEQIAEKFIAGLGALLGAAVGIALGFGPGGVLLMTLAGLALGLIADTLIFDGDGKLSEKEIIDMILVVLSTLTGGVIGFISGGAWGAAIGASVGFALSLVLKKLLFDKVDISGEKGFITMLAIALGTLAGTYIGFKYGTFGGASLLGLAVGVALSLAVVKILFDYASSKTATENFYNSEFGQQFQELKDKIEESVQMDIDLKAHIKSITGEVDENTMATLSAAQSLLNEIFSISEEENLTAEQIAVLQEKVTAFNSLGLEGIQLEFDATTGKVSQTRGEVQGLLDDLLEQYKLEAMREAYIESYKSQYEATQNVETATSNLNSAMASYDQAVENAAAAQGELNAAQEAFDEFVNGDNGGLDYNTKYEELSAKVSEATEKYNAAKAAVTETSTAITDAKTALESSMDTYDTATEKIGNIETALTDLATASNDDGKNVMAGMADGIETGTEEAKTAMEKAAEAIQQAERDYHQINSPSKLYEEEGKYLMEGMANGITAGAPTVQTALTTVMQAMLNQLKVSLETARAYVQSTIRNLQSIVNNAKFRLEVHGSYPIFSVSTRTVAGQTIPSISRRMVYYAKGGIVDSATLFGNNVIGEAGKEAIVPLERHTEWISMVAEDLSDMIGTDGISDKLSTLATYMGKVPDAISKLTEAFTTTPKPAMANGSVVPPSALASASVANLSQDEVYSLLADVKGVVMSAANLVTKAISDKETDISIDGTTLARKMYSYNKAVSKEHGASLVVT